MANALYSETSRYLQQHKDQPVYWLPWGEPALALAREQNKPILLSIGYSTCHWCHVMAKESFSDVEVARRMNDYFVNIKVDREERPDLDEIYQTAHQLLTGQAGGWPLTVFLCPRTRLPFIAGSYFRKHSTDEQLGFFDLLQRVHDFYNGFSTNFTVLRDKVKKGYERLSQPVVAEGKSTLNLSPMSRALKVLLREADDVHGGFGTALKFPMVPRLELLYTLANSEDSASAAAEEQLAITLSGMARGGIADHVSGGFFRYSTDPEWEIPHFEKMLCDNGQLLQIYAKGWNHFDDLLYLHTAAQIADWALTEMRNQDGVFCSAMDADYHELEGAYYVFSEEQLHHSLSVEEYGLMSAACGWEDSPNYAGHWHLHRKRSLQEVAEFIDIPLAECQRLYFQACTRLRQLRRQQPLPERDEKIKTGWNGLMIRGLVAAARYFPDGIDLPVSRKECLLAAQQAVDFIYEHLWINQRLFAIWQDGSPKLSGYLDDYVYLMDALLDLLQVSWRDQDYRFLIGLAESLSSNFEDTENGGFFFTAHDRETLIYRPKPWADGVLPSANGLVAEVFLRLGQLAAEPRYGAIGQRILNAGWHELERQPESHSSLLAALDAMLMPPLQVLLYGDESMRAWQDAINEHYMESIYCYWVPLEAEFCPPDVLVADTNTALVCAGDQCWQEHRTLDGLMAQLTEHLSGEDCDSSDYPLSIASG